MCNRSKRRLRRLSISEGRKGSKDGAALDAARLASTAGQSCATSTQDGLVSPEHCARTCDTENNMKEQMETKIERRRRSIDTARLSFDAALPRLGRVARQCRRAFYAHDGIATMTQLRQWCFAGQRRQHWHYWSITRALRRLNAVSLGRAGRPGIWAARDNETRGQNS